MSLQGKALEEITEEDFQSLIDNRVRESQTLEYKREVYGRGDEEVREMLRDISSMANAFGGNLLIGVQEDGEGIAVALPGVENADVEANRIISSCLSNIEERFSFLGTRLAPLSNGRHVIVIRIPRSIRGPHMITFRGLNQFWARHDRQKAPMSIHEIKDACMKIEGLVEKLERFLENRRREIFEEIHGDPYYVVSVTPIFVDTEVIDIRDSSLRNILENPPGQRQSGWNLIFQDRPEPTLHGLAIGNPLLKALELFRNGHIELRVSIDLDSFCRHQVEIEGQQHPVLYPYPLVEYPVSLLRLSKAIYAYLGLTDPLIVSVSICNISGFALERLATQGPRMMPVQYYGPRPWRKEHLEIAPRQTIALEEPDRVAKRFVDRIWQAFGYEHAPLFDNEGNFRPE